MKVYNNLVFYCMMLALIRALILRGMVELRSWSVFINIASHALWITLIVSSVFLGVDLFRAWSFTVCQRSWHHSNLDRVFCMAIAVLLTTNSKFPWHHTLSFHYQIPTTKGPQLIASPPQSNLTLKWLVYEHALNLLKISPYKPHLV